MKTACSAVLLAFFLLLSQGVVFAAPSKPSDLYRVHSIPDGTKTSIIHNQESTPKPIQTVKPDLSYLTHKAYLERQAAEKSLWDSFTDLVNNSVERGLNLVNSTIVIPLQKGIHKSTYLLSTDIRSVDSSFFSILTNTKYSFSHFAHATVLFLSQSIHKTTNAVTNRIFQLTKTVADNSAKVISIATTVTGLSLGALYFGRSLFATSVRMGMEGVVSMGDMILRGVSLLTGSLVSLFTGRTIAQGYESSLIKIKEVFGRDVGDAKHDTRILGRNVVIGVGGLLLIGAIVYGAPAITAANSVAGTLTTKVSPDVVLKTQYILSRTANDCSLIGQCEDAIGLGITVVSNTLFGISPSTRALATVGDDALKYTDEVMEEGYILSKTTNVNDPPVQISDISKALNKIDSEVLKEVQSDWYKSTLPSREFSIKYHWEKHGIKKNRNVSEYTQDAKEFFNKNKQFGKRVILKDGSEGLHFKLNSTKEGGYFTQDGKIVTFWYE